MDNNEQTKKKDIILTGEVVSNKADKTITVNVDRIFKHPVYLKTVRKKKKYLVHDEQNKCRPGDKVRIRLVRPISKHKNWLLMDVISTAPVKEVAK